MRGREGPNLQETFKRLNCALVIAIRSRSHPIRQELVSTSALQETETAEQFGARCMLGETCLNSLKGELQDGPLALWGQGHILGQAR